MKKQTKLEKRRKTVLGAVLGFGAVALLTTATATWIIAVNNSTFDGDIGVTVDTVQNNSVKLSVVIDNNDKGLNVAEDASSFDPEGLIQYTSSDDTLAVDGGSISIPDFKIKLSTITVEYGSNFCGADEKLVLNLSLKYGAGLKNNGSNLAKEADDLIGKRTDTSPLAFTVASTGEGEPDSWTYVELETTQIELNTGTGDTTKTSTTEGKTVTFTWGSFFDNKSPATYYNELFQADTAQIQDAANIESELANMKSRLEQGLVLTCSVAAVAA